MSKVPYIGLVAAVLVTATSVLSPAHAEAGGPALSESASTLAASLTCSPDLTAGQGEPVLLVPGTTLTPQVEFSWNYERAFDAQGRPWCAVTLPKSAMGDIQVAAEYVVNAIRHLHEVTGHRVQIVGHSQGGMVPRWALRYWPDTRPMVDDVIGLAPSNHGTVDGNAVCLPLVGCAPAFWQQREGSAFLSALNSGDETYAGISYTSVYTTLVDEVVQPNLDASGSSSLHTGAGDIANIAVQDICPVHVADHLILGTADPVAYALVMDALTHRGPAEAARIDHGVCTQALQPGVNPATFATDFATETAYVATTLALSAHVPREPALKGYAR